MVPPTWEHPKRNNGKFIPLLDIPFEECVELWRKEGDANEPMPKRENSMPTWDKSECTHLQMYETCSEGTPISPVMDTPENLARWLSDNKASACGSMTATYEEWLAMINVGWALTMMFSSATGLQSGVASSVGIA